ncbi:MAG TPA: TolC family protein [Bryobacteraceae bacterium]|nr:TolC family protein [Bryobacteraceae bacterium]
MLRCSLLLAVAAAAAAFAQTPRLLTLADAQAIAAKNHPRVNSLLLNAQATDAVTRQIGAGRYPTLASNLTGVGAQNDSAVAAGNVTTSSLSSRVPAMGIVGSQLLYDFGRISYLSKSSELRAGAQRQTAEATKAQIALQVRTAYFQSLQAQSVLQVARETVAARRLTLRQVTRLFESKLKSSLDVSFAEVNLSEAELLLFKAENDIKAALTDLAAAMGLDSLEPVELKDELLPDPLGPDAAPLIEQALRNRPELRGAKLQHDSALQFARAEKSLLYPSVSVIGAAGVVPIHQDKINTSYSAVGVNVSIPILNGGLFSSRKAEADLRAQAAAQDTRDLEIRIERDVKLAWLNATNAFRRLDVTSRLLDQANRSLRLAQSRYDLGLGSIVELNQAQLNKTSAEIGSAGARYEYQIQRAILDFQAAAVR